MIWPPPGDSVVEECDFRGLTFTAQPPDDKVPHMIALATIAFSVSIVVDFSPKTTNYSRLPSSAVETSSERL